MNKNNYEVIVGNIGTMNFTNQKIAIKTYNDYKRQSIGKVGRAADENVTLLKNGEIVKEHFGNVEN
jgi:hypothetical protein